MRDELDGLHNKTLFIFIHLLGINKLGEPYFSLSCNKSSCVPKQLFQNKNVSSVFD